MTRAIEAVNRDYSDMCRQFEWQIPEFYNIGTDVCDLPAAENPKAVAILFEDKQGRTQQYSFGEIRTLSNRLANSLAHRGCARGDRIAVLLPQGPETGIAHVGIYKLGAIAVPLSSLFGPDALEYRLRDSGAHTLITDAAGKSKLGNIRESLPDLKHVYLVDGSAEVGEFDLHRELEKASPHFTSVRTRAEDPAFIIYTSGTTGSPKGVLHAHRALLGHLPGFELSHSFFPQPGDLFWSPADWAWAGGLLDSLLPAWHYGYPILAFIFAKGFDPERAFWLIDRYQVRNTFLPPTALKMMRQVKGPTKSYKTTLRTIMSAGESLGREMLEWGSNSLGITINEMFGQTEANYIVGNCHDMLPVKPGSMGVPYPGHDVAVVDREGRVLPKGKRGEIGVRRGTPVMFLEYWKKPDATLAKFSRDWLLTGDIAVSDDEGYLFFQGRSDDIISSAGYRIGPMEIEECLIKHPAVALAAVIGVPDQLRGNIIKAFVQLVPGYTASDALMNEIQAHVKQRLAAYEYPRLMEFVETIPTTTTGKLQRAELRRREERLRAKAD
ncbi:MAG: AMP-binding protein [Terriglobia bacterium]